MFHSHKVERTHHRSQSEAMESKNVRIGQDYDRQIALPDALMPLSKEVCVFVSSVENLRAQESVLEPLVS